VTAEQYLNGLLVSYSVNTAGAKRAGEIIYPVLERWGNEFLIRADYSGSLAKGTGVSLSTDADIFLSLSSNTPGTLADIYLTLANAVGSAGYPVRMQNVSIGTTVNGFSIDLVPARRQSQYGGVHSLYRSRAGTWIQTNIGTHISYVTKSGRMNEIRIMKLWRQRHGLRFPSFYLEMAVIDALYNARHGDISVNVWRVLEYLRDNIQNSRFVDPANTNNIVSDDCNAAEKKAIALAAVTSLSKRTWGEIVW